MIHGHSIGASAESETLNRALARAAGTWGGYQAWRQLEPEKRLELIEQALKPANDVIDAFPLAL